MLYYIFKYLDEAYNLPGSGMFQYISFRAAASIILALLIVIIFGRFRPRFLRLLRALRLFPFAELHCLMPFRLPTP